MGKIECMADMPTKVLPFLYRFASKQWGMLVLTALIAASVNVATSTVWPLITGELVDTFSSLEQHGGDVAATIRKPLILAFFFWILVECLNRVKGFLLAYRLPIFEAAIRLETFKHVIQHSHSYFLNRYVGAVAHRIDDLPRSARFIVDDVVTVFFPTILSVLASSGVMFTLNPLLSSVFIAWLTFYTFAASFFCSHAMRYSSIESDSRAIVQGGIVDSLRNSLSMKIFDGFEYEAGVVSQLQNDEVLKYKFSLSYMEKSKIVLSVLNTIGVMCLIYASIRLWQLNAITVGDMTYVVISTLNILTVIWYASDELTYVFNEVGICSQSLSIINDPYKTPSDQYASDLRITDGAIELQDVHFKYPDSNSSFTVEKLAIEGGQTVGLVGLSGSGKTTFIQLLLRLFDIHSGRILIDKQDIASVSLSSLRNGIAFIQQDPILFHRSIRDNIRYANGNATEDEIIEAAKKANCWEFISQISTTLDAIVGEGGTKLSSGQKQRIMIARAILKNSKILIMDEATSALDSDTENEVQRGMEFLLREKTVLVVAHRLSTLVSVDRLLVFHEGHIVEDGSHEQLLRQDGYYAKFWKMQNIGFQELHEI